MKPPYSNLRWLEVLQAELYLEDTLVIYSTNKDISAECIGLNAKAGRGCSCYSNVDLHASMTETAAAASVPVVTLKIRYIKNHFQKSPRTKLCNTRPRLTAEFADMLRLRPSRRTPLYMISSRRGASTAVEISNVPAARLSCPETICLATSAVCKLSSDKDFSKRLSHQMVEVNAHNPVLIDTWPVQAG